MDSGDCKCFEIGNSLKDQSTIMLIAPPVILVVSLIIEIASIWFFFSAVGHEMIELERMTILFVGMIIERGIPSELSKTAYAKAETMTANSGARKTINREQEIKSPDKEKKSIDKKTADNEKKSTAKDTKSTGKDVKSAIQISKVAKSA